MVTMVHDRELELQLKAQRVAVGADRYDEVWEGMTMLAPMPNEEHQDLVALFTAMLVEIVRLPGLGKVMPGVNLSDREEDWKDNYRIPDVAVFLAKGIARNCGTHWCGGADFLIEIVSPDDQSREKIPFYSNLGTQELLLVDRESWALELLTHDGNQFLSQGVSTLAEEQLLESRVLPLSFRLCPGEPRPQVEVVQRDSGKRWTI